jgi:hypothetical protein
MNGLEPDKGTREAISTTKKKEKLRKKTPGSSRMSRKGGNDPKTKEDSRSWSKEIKVGIAQNHPRSAKTSSTVDWRLRKRKGEKVTGLEKRADGSLSATTNCTKGEKRMEKEPKSRVCRK